MGNRARTRAHSVAKPHDAMGLKRSLLGILKPAALVLLAVAASACSGPPPNRAGTGETVALAVTPDGTVWTIDGASATVVALRAGAVVQRLGGLGTGADALLDPVDLDPTNGQAIFVADRAAGAVLHFTAEGRLAAMLAVPDVDPARPVRERVREALRGQPIAVAAAPDGALYIVDAGRRHVLRLAAEGSVERVLGASGPGALVDPVDLAVADDGTVWVADAGRGALQAFDPYGAPTRTVAAGAEIGRVVGVSVWGPAVALAAGRGVTVVDGDAAQTQVRALDLPDLRAVALVGRGRWWALSASGIEPGGIEAETGGPERD